MKTYLKNRLRAWLPPLAGALLLFAAGWILHRELQSVSYREVRQALHALPTSQLLLALMFTGLNYLVLSLYDQLAFRYLGGQVTRARIAVTALTSYAISNSVGFAVLSGTAVRHRFYSRWGVSAADLARIIVFNSSTYWLGLLALAGWSLTFQPPIQSGLFQASMPWLGGLCLALAAAYLVLSTLRKAPFQVRGFEIRVPTPPLAFQQLLVSMADWALAAAVLHALLPESGPSYGTLLGAFLAAQVFGLISHVPGGLGVFEGAMLLFLGPYLPVDQIIAALILFRLIYYIIPLVFALLVLLGDEARHRGEKLVTLGKSLGGYSTRLAPRALSVFTFMAGLLLLVSGATPADQSRLLWLADILPVGLFEASHFLGSLVGVALLVLAQAISRRIRPGYYLVVAALMAGILASLLKAADWEEAIVLACVLGALIPCRNLFDRSATLFSGRFSPGWIIAIVAALGSSIWLGFFTFRHIEYSNDLWWQVALNKDAPRFLRASVGAAVALMGFGLWRLLRPVSPVAELPSDEAIADASHIINAQADTLPLLVYLRDKALWFNPDHTAFVMYGIRGRTWVSLGDPVGPTVPAQALIRDFVEHADDFGGVPVFYQVKPQQLFLYAELGMSFAKLGEEARVPLEGFSLQGRRYRDLRLAMNRLAKEQVDFRIVDAADVPAIMPQLKAVSDDWLASKSASEKGFSLGFFDADYLSRMPVAVLEQEGRILAFANLLCGPSGEELSVDLMRFASFAPRSAMDGLFAHLFLWGQAEGYQWFNLGMAPLSGLEVSPVSPVWARLGRIIYRHGEAFYNFGGIRAFKAKFHPIWESRYIAYPGESSLLLILADIAALSAGSYWRLLR
ncbi:MAG: bifunctional lysylphosphatidylglycerol flippase/synthetase MprF, partial [Marinobacter sp.]|nr:bifunctional lysylphosphatidylglycerol flippase/synthetase MprF [Marinobacter sp.]